MSNTVAVPSILDEIVKKATGGNASDWSFAVGRMSARASEAITDNSTYGRVVSLRNNSGSFNGVYDMQLASNADQAETIGLLGVAQVTNIGTYSIVSMHKGMAGLDTSLSSIGAPVWLSTGGGWTLTKPTSGYLRVLGRVTRLSATAGLDTWFFAPEAPILGNTETIRWESTTVGTTGSVKSKVVYPAGTIRLTIDTEAATADYTYTVPFACRLNPASVRGRTTDLGGAGDTVRLYNGTDPITEAFDLNAIADETAFEFATYVKAQLLFAAGDVFKVTTASGALAEIDLELEST